MENNIKHIHYPANTSTFRRLYSDGVITEEEYYAASRLLYRGYTVEEITKELLTKEIKEFHEKLRKNSKHKRIIVTVFIIAVLLFSAIIISSINQNKTIPKNETQTVMVYITRTGSKYHKNNCSYLCSSKIEISLENAIQESYSPCSRCRPPRQE